MIEEIQQVEQKLNKEGIKATSAVDQHELTPPKLMLGYFFMVSGQEQMTDGAYFVTFYFKAKFNTGWSIKAQWLFLGYKRILKRDKQIVTYNYNGLCADFMVT